MLLLAHRGASADFPENTLAAFQGAIDQGADGVELDVRVCASGEVVVSHDDTLERVAGVSWRVERTTWSRLRTLEVGAWKGDFNERLPLLDEVLELLPQRMVINVELKCETLDAAPLARACARILSAPRNAERVVVSSFHAGALMALAQAAPSLRRGYLVDPDKPFWLHGAALLPLTSSHTVHPHFSLCTPARMARWRAQGLAVAVWTVDAMEEAARLAALGTSYCITNRPAALRAELAQPGRRGLG